MNAVRERMKTTYENVGRERKVKEKKLECFLEREREREMVIGKESPTMNETKFASNVKKMKKKRVFFFKRKKKNGKIAFSLFLLLIF